MMPTVEDAIALAVGKHRGQQDKAGKPYILHPLRVMLSMATDEERRVAVLHDVMEDCGVTRSDLKDLGYPETEIAALEALTKAADEHGDYEKFIERVAKNPLAVRVKLADLKDNMDLSRLDVITDEDRKRIAKYERARDCLGLTR
ncbi:MAG TPA: GTP pyrophosphokinase [Myxococcales bacterium]|jgi:(p)ppGpp synthase/HD superfamily hydrolase